MEQKIKVKDVIAYIQDKYSKDDELDGLLLIMRDNENSHQFLHGDATFLYVMCGKIMNKILSKLPG